MREPVTRRGFVTRASGLALTGLGLAAVYGIIKASGGNIFVSSKLNQGATFQIIFPRTHNGGQAFAPTIRAA